MQNSNAAKRTHTGAFFVYFITICTKNRAPILSEIVGDGDLDAPWNINNTTPRSIDNTVPIKPNNTVQIKLTEYGMIAEEYIKSMRNDKYKIIIDAYVIMPDHVHMVIFVEDYHGKPNMINPHGTSDMIKHRGTSGSPSPTNAVDESIKNIQKIILLT